MRLIVCILFVLCWTLVGCAAQRAAAEASCAQDALSDSMLIRTASKFSKERLSGEVDFSVFDHWITREGCLFVVFATKDRSTFDTIYTFEIDKRGIRKVLAGSRVIFVAKPEWSPWVPSSDPYPLAGDADRS